MSRQKDRSEHEPAQLPPGSEGPKAAQRGGWTAPPSAYDLSLSGAGGRKSLCSAFIVHLLFVFSANKKKERIINNHTVERSCGKYQWLNARSFFSGRPKMYRQQKIIKETKPFACFSFSNVKKNVAIICFMIVNSISLRFGQLMR